MRTGSNSLDINRFQMNTRNFILPFPASLRWYASLVLQILLLSYWKYKIRDINPYNKVTGCLHVPKDLADHWTDTAHLQSESLYRLWERLREVTSAPPSQIASENFLYPHMEQHLKNFFLQINWKLPPLILWSASRVVATS